jgi:hypothetical protein
MELLAIGALIAIVSIVCFTPTGFDLQLQAGRSLDRALFGLQQWWCGVRHGHSATLAVGRHHLALTCDSCGYRSPGIDVEIAVKEGSRR